MLLKTCVSLTVFTAFLVCAATAEPLPLTVGVLHSEPTLAMQLAAAADAALQHAAEDADEEAIIGTVEIGAAEPGEPIDLLQALCRLAAARVTVWMCGACGDDAAALRAAADRVGLLQLNVERTELEQGGDVLALYPSRDALARVAAVLMGDKGWQEAVLLHDSASPPGALLALGDADPPVAMTTRRLPPPTENALLRNLLLVLKRGGARHFAVWCERKCLLRVLDAAQRAGLLSERYSYLLLDLDLHTLQLANYSYGGANVTGLRLFDPASVEVRRAMEAWREAYLRRAPAQAAEEEALALVASPPTALLLAYDAVRLTAAAWRTLGELPASVAPPSCMSGRGSLHTQTLLNFIRTTEARGATGPLRWEGAGRRAQPALEVVELMRGGEVEAVARWVRAAGSAGASATGEHALVWTRRAVPVPPIPDDDMTNRTFNVLIALRDPYIMYRESAARLSGNDRFEGFCVELIERLAEALHFNYTFVLHGDSLYGTYNNKTGWNGMMKRLIEDDDIHFAVTDLTITAERERAVDFTTPFMNLGISILFMQPTEPMPAFFAFLLPFSPGVWACLGLAYVGTTLLLYTVGRLCPEEWQNPYPCIEEPVALENQFTLANAFWFTLGSVLLQGSEIAPVAYGTRSVASMWWLFALVITSSYTANLATLLAKKTTADKIHSVDDLPDNDLGITYGTVAGGSTYDFFQKSQDPRFQKMFEHMRNQLMPKNNSAGIEKVMAKNYAFLMESTTIEYITQRNCEVKQVGGLLDSKGYGIAMKKNSTYRQALNLALLNLQESGVLREMKNIWWNQRHGGGSCTEDNEVESAKLSLHNFKGLFLVLLVGSVLGVILSFGDLLIHARRSAVTNGVSLRRQLWAELRFVFQFERGEKPLELAPSPTPPPTPPTPPASPSPAPSHGQSTRRRSTRHTLRASIQTPTSPLDRSHATPQ